MAFCLGQGTRRPSHGRVCRLKTPLVLLVLMATLSESLSHLSHRMNLSPEKRWSVRCFAAPAGEAPAGEDYEAAFSKERLKRLKQVRETEAAQAKTPKAPKKQEPFLGAAFFDGRAVEPESGKNFLTAPEWDVLVKLVAVLMVLTTVVFAYKMSPWGRGF